MAKSFGDAMVIDLKTRIIQCSTCNLPGAAFLRVMHVVTGDYLLDERRRRHLQKEFQDRILDKPTNWASFEFLDLTGMIGLTTSGQTHVNRRVERFGRMLRFCRW